MRPRLSLITTCKNRLPHLKQTLPLMLRQPRAEVIVVDYGCEQGTSAWVQEHHPAAKLVQVNDDPVFAAARARNIGAKNAAHEFFCFVDADVELHMELGKWLKSNWQPGSYFVYPSQNAAELAGFIILTREQFQKVSGYDEAFRGWGGEDIDLDERLARAGFSKSLMPADSLVSISHGDELRQLGKDAGGFGTKRETLSMNQLYRMIKRDSWNLTGTEIELERRKALFQFLRALREDALVKGKADFLVSFDIPIEMKHNRYAASLRTLSYRTPLKPPVR